MSPELLLALSPGLVWSIINVAHKILASKLINNPKVMLIIYGFIMSLVSVGLAFFSTGLIQGQIWWLIVVAGIVNSFGVWIYLMAMQKYEPSRVIPLFAIGAVVIIISSALILGEVFDLITYVGIGVILLGSLILSIKKTFFSAFSSKILWTMTLSGICFAFSAIVIKYLLGTYSVTQVFSSVGIIEGPSAIIIALFYFKEIRQTIRQIKKRYLLYNALTEVVSISGSFLYTIAISVWYLSLVETLASLQFLFVFIWSLIISRFMPSLYAEELNRRIIIQKIAAIILIIFGVYLIS